MNTQNLSVTQNNTEIGATNAVVASISVSKSRESKKLDREGPVVNGVAIDFSLKSRLKFEISTANVDAVDVLGDKLVLDSEVLVVNCVTTDSFVRSLPAKEGLHLEMSTTNVAVVDVSSDKLVLRSETAVVNTVVSDVSTQPSPLEVGLDTKVLAANAITDHISNSGVCNDYEADIGTYILETNAVVSKIKKKLKLGKRVHKFEINKRLDSVEASLDHLKSK